MIVMVCVDNRNGMMFNHRRQSQDRVLRRRNILDERLQPENVHGLRCGRYAGSALRGRGFYEAGSTGGFLPAGDRRSGWLHSTPRRTDSV